jgi:hypothetical protein
MKFTESRSERNGKEVEPHTRDEAKLQQREPREGGATAASLDGIWAERGTDSLFSTRMRERNRFFYERDNEG